MNTWGYRASRTWLAIAWPRGSTETAGAHVDYAKLKQKKPVVLEIVGRQKIFYPGRFVRSGRKMTLENNRGRTA